LNATSASYQRLTVIELPGEPLRKFDIGWVDATTRRYYLADRSNARVAAIDIASLSFLRSIGDGDFAGAPADGKLAGPNGVTVLADAQQVWSGDGDSSVKVHDATSGALIAAIPTGGVKRVDELAYAPSLDVVLAANDAEAVPFVTLIGTREHEIRGRIELPDATNGVHQPIWDPTAEMFYVPVSEVGGDKARGEIVVVDPRTAAIVRSIAVAECQPSGLAIGPRSRLCVGCNKNAIAAGYAPRTLILDLEVGSVVRVDEVGGSDEVWYNPGDQRFYIAASGMTGGPVLGVIDAVTRRWITNVATANDAHSVAVDATSGLAFVPMTPSPEMPKGGIAVFAERDQTH
jgi:DNA-binding beta-propeller fold protein YncE